MSVTYIRRITLAGLAAAFAFATTACDQQEPPAPEPAAEAPADTTPEPAAPEPAAGTPATPPPGTEPPTTSPEEDPVLARGEYLMRGLAACGNCHSPRDEDGRLLEGMELAGAFVIEEPEFRAYAPNITPDEETGIGTWSDEEIMRAVREGVRPDGTVLGPPMAYPFYRDISDGDMEAIVAYLRSVPAVRNEVPRSTFNIPLPPNWGPPVESVPEPSRDDALEYGRYLTHTVGHCTDCHTPLVEGQHDFSRIGAGGNVFPQPFGMPWSAVAANITSHPDLGIGNWSDEEIKRAIVDGVRPDGRVMLPFMGFDYYKNITDEDLDLIVAYLRTLPPSTATPPADH